jgi:hypothetical protein
MPILTNPRQEQFCQHRAAGKSLEEAYGLAGYKPHQANAERMSRFDGVRQRIEELRAEHAQTFEVTAESLKRELDAAIEFARECKQPSAIVAAINSKAKLFGLMTDRSVVSVTHNYAMMSEEELRFEIAAIHAEARAIKAGVKH